MEDQEAKWTDIYFDMLYSKVTFTVQDYLDMTEEQRACFQAAAAVLRETEAKLLGSIILDCLLPDEELIRTEGCKNRFEKLMKGTS